MMATSSIRQLTLASNLCALPATLVEDLNGGELGIEFEHQGRKAR